MSSLLINPKAIKSDPDKNGGTREIQEEKADDKGDIPHRALAADLGGHFSIGVSPKC